MLRHDHYVILDNEECDNRLWGIPKPDTLRTLASTKTITSDLWAITEFFSGFAASSILKQVRYVEFRHLVVGNLLLWSRALPPDTSQWRGGARGEWLPDGGSWGLSSPGVQHHEGCEYKVTDHVNFTSNVVYYSRRGILIRKRDPLLWRLETVWKSLKFRILSDLLWWSQLRVTREGLLRLKSYCDTKLDLARLITTFLFPLNNNKNAKTSDYYAKIPQLTHCSDIVLIEN